MASTQRPASSRPLSPATADSSLGAVIAEFLAEPAVGADRQFRSALRHIEAELGTMPVANVRPRHVTALLDDLHRAGLSPRREADVADALQRLFAYATARRLVAVNPMPGPAPMPTSRPTPTPTPTPTFTMLAVGTRLVGWLTWLIMAGFLALLLMLLIELG
jgi:hypothetical protein